MIIALIACAAIVAPVLGAGGYVFDPEDSSEALFVKYSGSGATPQITVTTTTIVLTEEGIVNTLTLADDSYTLAEVAAWASALTNSSGNVVWEAKIRAGLSSDIVTNDFVIAVAATAMRKNTWEPHVIWDTSAVTNFSLCPSSILDRQYANGYCLDWITGEPGGTGDLTLSVYEDDVLIWRQTITSPYYVIDGTVGSALATNQPITVVTLDQPLHGIRTFEGKRYLVRAQRATTATTGTLGLITSPTTE